MSDSNKNDKVQYENTKPAAISHPMQLKGSNSNEFLVDALNRKKVKLVICKGNAETAKHFFDINPKIIRLKVELMGDLKRFIPIDGIVTKDIVESVDVEIGLIEHFLNTKLKKVAVSRIMGPIKELHKARLVGHVIGEMVLDYGIYTELVSYLQYLSYETFNKEDVL